jgi:hypothetical protein
MPRPAPGNVSVVQSAGQEVNPAFCIGLDLAFYFSEALPQETGIFRKKKRETGREK